MTEERKYIYSIIKNPKPFDLTQGGSFRLPEIISGINNRELIFIPHRDIAAAVSNIHLINFDKLDKKKLIRFISEHGQVNADLMKKHEVIPMRFGMVAENIEGIRGILAKAYIQFKTVLERTAGKAEFVVQVFWNKKNTLEKIVQENAEIQKLKKSAESKGMILGFPSKMELGKLVFEAIEAYRQEYSVDILGNLATYFPDFSAGKLLDTDKEEVSGETNKVILINHSFLIDKTEESALGFQLNKLAEKYKDELKFKYTGPMAPYSFAAINLGVGNFALVDNARKTLGLGESATLPEIKKAYYKLAQEHHPDKHEYKKDRVIVEEAARKMKNLVAANEVLSVYCRHCFSALPPGIEQMYSFKKENIENSIIISAKGGSASGGKEKYLT